MRTVIRPTIWHNFHLFLELFEPLKKKKNHDKTDTLTPFVPMSKRASVNVAKYAEKIYRTHQERRPKMARTTSMNIRISICKHAMRKNSPFCWNLYGKELILHHYIKLAAEVREQTHS